MMRKTLSVIISGVLATSVANAVEVYNKDDNKLDLYGRADVRHIFAADADLHGDASYVRLGFNGETKVNDQLTGYGQWEYDIQANRPESAGPKGNVTRLGFAGLKFADYGSFDYGRNWGVLYDLGGWIDMQPIFSGGGESYMATDNYMTTRANSLATYRNRDFFGLIDGLDIALQYQGKNVKSDETFRKIEEENGDGFGFSSIYNTGSGITIGTAYTSSNRTERQNSQNNPNIPDTALGNKAQAWTAGIKYDANNIYLAATYAETLNMTPFGSMGSKKLPVLANKTQNIGVVAHYQFDFGLRPAIAWTQSKGKDLTGIAGTDGGKGNLVDFISVASFFDFNKNMSTYVDYKINLLNKNSEFIKATGISVDNVVGAGMVYKF